MTTLPVVLLLHYQNDVVHPQGRIQVGLAKDDPARAKVLASAERLLLGARRLGLPVIHGRVAYRTDFADLKQNAPIFRAVVADGSVQEGTWGAEFYETMAPKEGPREFVVKHTRINVFFDSSLEPILCALDATHLIVAGVSTHSVVESTVRHAVDCGYHVSVAADACSSARPHTHEASLDSMRLIAEISDVTTLLEVAS